MSIFVAAPSSTEEGSTVPPIASQGKCRIKRFAPLAIIGFVYSLNVDDMEIIAGRYNLNKGGISRKIRNMSTHPDYEGHGVLADMAKLDFEEFKPHPDIEVISLATSPPPFGAALTLYSCGGDFKVGVSSFYYYK